MTSPPNPRIVSLLASATEITCSLGLRDQLVGRSHECDYPEDVVTLPALSEPKVDPALPSIEIDRNVRDIVRDGLSVYDIRTEALGQLRPDVIVTQDHCEVCAVSLTDVEDALCKLTSTDTVVCSLHPNNLQDVCRDFQKVANATGVPRRGEQLIATFRKRLETVQQTVSAATRRPRVALIEWLQPPMIAGGWMPEIAKIAGGEPIIVADAVTFETVEWSDVVSADPEIVAILPCGFSLQRTIEELETPTVREALARIPAVAKGQCYALDGNAYFNRPGPRLADSAELLAGILHPKLASGFRQTYEHAFRKWL